jgi:hypothetical protein
MTFSQMQTEVGDLLNMTISANSTVTTTQVKRDLNTARDLVLNRLLVLGQNYFLRIAKANLVADQALYSLPTDFRKFARLEVGYESATDRVKVDQLDLNEIGDPSVEVYSTADPKYTIVGNMFELRPTPTASLTDGLYMIYIENPSDMSGDSDTSGLPLDYDNLLTLYASAKGKYTLGLPQEGNNMMAQFNMGLDEMENNIIERNIDSGGTIAIVDEYGGL